MKGNGIPNAEVHSGYSINMFKNIFQMSKPSKWLAIKELTLNISL